jgi:hypothetical protein
MDKNQINTAGNSKLPLLPPHLGFENCFHIFVSNSADNFSLRRSATTAICGTLNAKVKIAPSLVAFFQNCFPLAGGVSTIPNNWFLQQLCLVG